MEKTGHRFIRYADDFVVYVKSKRAGERVMESIKKYVEEDLNLTINQKEKQICGATHATFLGLQHSKSNGKVGCRPSRAAKKRFKDKTQRNNSRKRPGTLKKSSRKINQTTSGLDKLLWNSKYENIHKGNSKVAKPPIKAINMEKMEEGHEQNIKCFGHMECP